MREILFRGKRLQGNDWVYGYFFKSDFNKRERESGKATLIFTPDCETFIMVPEWHNSLMVHADTIGQYTGLKDKNGVKIFEGDIVDVNNALVSGRFWVEYGLSGAFIVKDNDDRRYFLGGCNCTVIGNIYDNPELVEDIALSEKPKGDAKDEHRGKP